ncbi:hypothetical protein NEDG_01370 [Nematocida displodere]|uniref:C2H2-type domain-containing protein n=1 Tax=Nematocida displodere TaxID=1805483 RepID=A0A177EBI1_9MICR|nr:hypothetical protein NEDG_01370 [Nematocida displodere]
MSKRRHTEDTAPKASVTEESNLEDFYHIITKQSRLLTEEEFQAVSGRKYNYPQYVRSFYDLRVKDLLVKGYEKQPWFSERAVGSLWAFSDTFMRFRDFVASRPCSLRLESTNVESLLQTELFDRYKTGMDPEGVFVVVIRNLEMGASINELVEEIKSKVPLKEWGLGQGGHREGFKKTLYLRLNEISYEEFKEKTASVLPATAVTMMQQMPRNVPSAVRVSGAQFGDACVMKETEKTCKQIIKAMSELLGVPEVAETLKSLAAHLEGNEVTDLYVLALRKVFNFCYYCGVKYCSPYEMLSRCGIFHVRSIDTFDMSNPDSHTDSLSFYGLDRAEYFKDMLGPTADIFMFSTGRVAGPTGESEYVCKYCMKRFESEEYFEKHLSRKHVEYDAYIRLHKAFISVITSLNYQIIEFIEQTGQNLPFELHRYISKKKCEVSEENHVSYRALEKKYALTEQQPIKVSTFSDSEEEN